MDKSAENSLKGKKNFNRQKAKEGLERTKLIMHSKSNPKNQKLAEKAKYMN